MRAHQSGKKCISIFPTIKKVLLASLVFALTYGCSSNMKLIKLKKEDLHHLKNESEILAVHYQPEPFRVFTHNATKSAVIGSLFGAIGGAISGAAEFKAAGRTGAKMAEEHSLQDPALRIKENFLLALETEPGLNNIRSIGQPLSNDDMATLKNDFGNQTIFDFKSRRWKLYNDEKKPKLYHVDYEIIARLIRLRGSEVIWQANC